MLSLVIGLLTLLLVLISLLLILMVLVQLPKKDAGLGMAFGGATADALFGAGSGNVLTRWTKYAAGLFLGLSLFLSVLRNHEHRISGRYIAEQLGRQTQAAAVTPPLGLTNTNAALPVITLPLVSNAPAPAASNILAPPGTTIELEAPATDPVTAPPPATTEPETVPAPPQ